MDALPVTAGGDKVRAGSQDGWKSVSNLIFWGVSTRSEGGVGRLSGLMAGEAAARLLVIDDDVALSGLLSDWLGKHGFEVETANDGAIGLRSLYRMRPDLVILDVTMPRLDGWEVCRRIRDLS